MKYTGLQLRVYQMLQNAPWSRERHFKNKALAKLLTMHKHWDGENSVFKLQEVADLLSDYNSADRYWRLLTERHPEFRGSDWDDKTILSQKKVLSLEYEVGYHKDIRQLELIN